MVAKSHSFDLKFSSSSDQSSRVDKVPMLQLLNFRLTYAAILAFSDHGFIPHFEIPKAGSLTLQLPNLSETRELFTFFFSIHPTIC